MATKTKQTTMGASSLDALAFENGVVVLTNTESNDQAKPEPAPKKAAAKKKAAEAAKPETSTTQSEQPQKEETVERKSFDEIVREMDEREAKLNKREAELNEIADNLKKAAEMLKAAEAVNNIKEKQTMAEKKETTPATNLENLNIPELIKQQQAEFGKLTVKVESEDLATTAKKGFVAGAATAGGVLTMVGLFKLGCYLLGGGSSD